MENESSVENKEKWFNAKSHLERRNMGMVDNHCVMESWWKPELRPLYSFQNQSVWFCVLRVFQKLPPLYFWHTFTCKTWKNSFSPKWTLMAFTSATASQRSISKWTLFKGPVVPQASFTWLWLWESFTSVFSSWYLNYWTNLNRVSNEPPITRAKKKHSLSTHLFTKFFEDTLWFCLWNRGTGVGLGKNNASFHIIKRNE